MTAVRLDDVQALINLATGQGVGKYDPSASTKIAADGRSFIDQNTQAFYRRSHKILRKLVETIPNQMTFRWGSLTLGGDDGDADVKEELEQWAQNIRMRTVYNHYTGLATAFNQAQIAANETGNAGLVILADDGQKYDQPLAVSKIKEINGFFLADRWAIKPDLQGISLGSLEGGITHYRLTGQRAINQLQLVAANGKPIDTGGQRIHESRVLWFRGEELSDYSLQMNQGCDDSVLEGVIQSFKEYHAGIRGAGRMLADFDFFVHKIEGLLDKMLGDGSGEYQQKMDKRLQANSLMRSAYRGMAIDLQKEEIATVSRSVAGYNDLLEQILSNFLSNTDLQPSELLQRYPAGLANTGKTEQQNCNDRTRLYQGKKFDSNLRYLLRIIFNWKGGPTKGKEPKVWGWEWKDLYPTTPLEQSELELNWAQIDSSRIQSGVYSPDDAAKSHYASPEFNPHITIDFKERERLKKEQEQQALEAAQQQQEQAPAAEDPLAGLTFDAADPLVPPQPVRDAAKKGLQVRRALDSGAVPARVALLGRKLDVGEPLSMSDVRAIASYHQRHRPPAKLDASAPTALYLLHGGPVGKVWADRVLTPPKMDSLIGKICGRGFIEKSKQCHLDIPVPNEAPKTGIYSTLLFEPLPNYFGEDADKESKARANPISLRQKALKGWEDFGTIDNPRDGRNTAFVALNATHPKYGLIEARSADNEHVPTGYLRFNKSGEDFYAIDHIGSDPSFKGSGTQMVSALKRYAVANGKGIAVNGAGESAKEFYKKVGFKEGGLHDFEISHEDLKKQLQQKSDSLHLDDDSPIKRTLDWKGFKIGLQYQPFDLRHEKLLPCGYGEIIGTVAADGMPLDCYVGTQLNSDRVFVVSQLRADTGEFDEHKLFIGFDDDAPAIKDLFVSLMGQERFGGIKEIRPQEVLDFTEDEREDAIRMDKPCGKGFIAENKECHKDPVPRESTEAKAGSAVPNDLTRSFPAKTGSVEVFTNSKGEQRWLKTPNASRRYETWSTGIFPVGLENAGSDMTNYALKELSLSSSIDINRIISLHPLGGPPDSDLTEDKFNHELDWHKKLLPQILPDGGIVVMDGKTQGRKKVAEALGLRKAEFAVLNGVEPKPLKEYVEQVKGFFVKEYLDTLLNTHIGVYENGKIFPVTKERLEQISKIRELRADQLGTLPGPDVSFRGSTLKASHDNEDRFAAELAPIEDAFLGRKPTKIKSLKIYQARAKKWAEEQFGKFDEGANGFTLQQTLAHDVAHPIVHEMLKTNTDGINARFGSARQNDGKPSLVLEEAIVNVAEHLSRGDSIEASILNGARLARVLSRNKAIQSDAVRKQVRSREFLSELAKMGHELYRNDNFSLYMKHIRETNRISGTVTQAGDDFTNSASGG